MPGILAFAGSTRNSSFNKRLLHVAVGKARTLGAEMTLIDLKDFPMPLYDGDIEESYGLPENAVKLQQLMREHNGLLLACPEYNGSITPLLKNVIDWTACLRWPRLLAKWQHL